MKVSRAVATIAVLSIFLCSSCATKQKNTTINSSTDFMVESIASPTTNPTPTPTPTYAPGTELYGMLSVTGEIVIEPKYEYLDLFSKEGLARFCDHGSWGFVNTKGVEVIPAQYEDANNFSEGLAAVKVDGLYGFVDMTGMMVIEPQFEGVQDGFIYGRCVYMDGNREGLIDAEGQVIVEPTYTNIELYSSEYFIVTNASTSGAMYGVIDRMTNVVVEMQADEIYAVTDSGFYFTHTAIESKYDVLYDISGLFPPQCTHVFHPKFLLYKIVSDSMIPASMEGEKWGLIDLSEGELLIDYLYDGLSYRPGDDYAEVYYNGEKGVIDFASGNMTLLGNYDPFEAVFNGYIVYEKNGYYGVKSVDGTDVLPADYLYICPTLQDKFTVFPKEKGFCVINKQGEILNTIEVQTTLKNYIVSIDCWECYFHPFSDEEGIVDSDGFISGDGTEKVLMQCWPIRVNNDDEKYYPNPIDLTTAPAIYDVGIINPINIAEPVEYYRYSWLPDQNVIVVENKEGKCGLVSHDGKFIFAFQDCHILTNDGLKGAMMEDSYIYKTYNDTDYLIYVVEAE